MGASLVALHGFSCPCTMRDLSSLTRDQTYVSCFARRILNHWTAKEVLKEHALKVKDLITGTETVSQRCPKISHRIISTLSKACDQCTVRKVISSPPTLEGRSGEEP